RRAVARLGAPDRPAARPDRARDQRVRGLDDPRRAVSEPRTVRHRPRLLHREGDHPLRRLLPRAAAARRPPSLRLPRRFSLRRRMSESAQLILRKVTAFVVSAMMVVTLSAIAVVKADHKTKTV